MSVGLTVPETCRKRLLTKEQRSLVTYERGASAPLSFFCFPALTIPERGRKHATREDHPAPEIEKTAQSARWALNREREPLLRLLFDPIPLFHWISPAAIYN